MGADQVSDVSDNAWSSLQTAPKLPSFERRNGVQQFVLQPEQIFCRLDDDAGSRR
jgi:hypothetical protein